nr:MAG TPA: hypothetical protein [Caudoviricetes sp.]
MTLIGTSPSIHVQRMASLAKATAEAVHRLKKRKSPL